VTGPMSYAPGPQIKGIAVVYKASFLALAIEILIMFEHL
jgi:hypothetical protein